MITEAEKSFFTIVFEGDIGSFEKNPLKTETPFGTPLIIARGNALDELDTLRGIVDKAEALK